MTDQIVDAEIVDEPGMALEVRSEGGLFRTEDPAEFLVKATDTATALAAAVRSQRLVVKIGQGEHVKVEGWTMLGSLLGVFPVGIWTRKLDDGWEARVEARTLTGQVIGAAEAECLRSEKTWANRDDYALRSMAQTRATSKALRMPLGFVMTLAGFDATPFEEMPPADELEAEQKQKRSRGGGLSGAQKKLYAEFKKREEAGKLTQDDLKSIVASTGAADIAHASDEQCEAAIKLVEDADLPFDETGAAQGSVPGTGHQHEAMKQSTGGASTYATDDEIAAFLEFAKARGAENLKTSEKAIEAHRKKNGGNVRADWLATILDRLARVAPEPVEERLPI